MTKGETVFYSASDGTVYRARVEAVHRDGTVSVVALFVTGADGKDRPGYLGFKYRMLPKELSVEHPFVAA